MKISSSSIFWALVSMQKMAAIYRASRSNSRSVNLDLSHPESDLLKSIMTDWDDLDNKAFFVL